MNKTEIVQSLLDRIKQPNQSLEVLTQLFEEYKTTVTEIAASGAAYKAALIHTHEEWPDLQRLISRKHDAILKGRLVDAITSLKKKVALIESPVETDEAAQEAPKADETADGKKPTFRIMPNLGMD